MAERKIDLQQLEKKAAAGIFQTGLVEIEIALIIIVASLAMIFDEIRYYLDILYVVPIVSIVLAIKYIANPRMGVVKLAKRRVRKNRLLMTAMTIFLVVMVALTIVGKANMIAELINPRWIISGIIFFVCMAVAYFMGFDRMYIYAFLLAGAFNLSEAIRENPGIVSEGGYAYLLAAIVLIVVGGVYLIRFLKKYPLPAAGGTYGN